MENNQSNTMNLGNNLGGAMPPVFGGNNSSTQQNNMGELNNNPQVVTSGYYRVEPVTSSIENNTTVAYTTATSTIMKLETNEDSVINNDMAKNKDNVSKEPIVLESDITIPTVLLRDMVSQARKVGVSNNMQPISEILNLIIDENGITVRASGGPNEADFECIDKRYISKNRLAVSLDIKIFGEYLNAEKNNIITLNYSEEEHTLFIMSESGMRRFPQRMDSSTHQEIMHQLKFPYNYNEMIEVDYDKFMENINLSSSARDLAAKLQNSFAYLQGVCFAKDIVIASDGTVMIIQPNNIEVKNDDFYLSNYMCNLIMGVKFNVSDFRIGLTKVGEEVIGVTFSDGRTTLCGPVIFDRKHFPIEPARRYWSSNDLSQSIRFETRAFVDVLKSIMPFMPNLGDAIDKITLDIHSEDAEIKSYDDTSRVVVSKETFKIINNTNYVTARPVALPISKLSKVLQTVKSDNFDMLLSPEIPNFICLSYDNNRTILTTLANS